MTYRQFLIAGVYLLSAAANATATERNRLHGYIGGPYKVVIADLTGDNLPDVLLGYHNVGVVAVWKGNGRGGFSLLGNNLFGDGNRQHNPDDATWSAPHVHNITVADIDGDGLHDAVFCIGGLSKLKPGRVVVARNAGDGKFDFKVGFPTPSQAKGVALADVDNDGTLDLLYTARGSGYKDDLKVGLLSIRRGLGGWRFGPAIESEAGKSAYYVETADLNNDGFLDIVIPNEHDSTVNCFINPGKRIFSHKTLHARPVRATMIPGRRAHAINDVRAADLNGDGNQDLVTANLGTSTISIFPGNGDGTFQKNTLLEAGKNAAFLAVGDFDGDKDIDFVITHWTEDFASVFLNAGDGTFSRRTDYKTGPGNYGVDAVDFNGDGHLDIVTANYRGLSMSLLIGVGDGTFQKQVTHDVGLRNLNGKWQHYRH